MASAGSEPTAEPSATLTSIVGFRHEHPDEGYLAKRLLRRHARVLELWALGVGAVVSGDFFGWNFGLSAGGFGGMLSGLAIMTLLFATLCCSIAEMSAALPHTGGAYSFARTAFGPWGGFITGLAENLEYILTTAVIVVGIGGYLGAIFKTPVSWAPLWWLFCYVVFVALNVMGVALSFRASVAFTFCALLVLTVFFAGSAPHFSLLRWALESGPWFSHGWRGVLATLPFALWVYLGIEQLPLAAEEAHDPVRDLPKGMFLALGTLVLFAFLTIGLNSGIAPGASAIARSQEPLFLGFRTIFGNGATARLLALAGCTGLIASFHAIIFAYGRQIYSLSRGGYFPTGLSVTHSRRQTPARALIAGSIIGYLAALAIYVAGQNSFVGATLLNMAVFGAVLAYVLQMLSFIFLRMRFPFIPRPYKSPLGLAGAITASIIALVTLGTLFANPDYRPGVIGAALWFSAGLVYFAVQGRYHLVLSPEEQFAEKTRSSLCSYTAGR